MGQLFILFFQLHSSYRDVHEVKKKIHWQMQRSLSIKSFWRFSFLLLFVSFSFVKKSKNEKKKKKKKTAMEKRLKLSCLIIQSRFAALISKLDKTEI